MEFKLIDRRDRDFGRGAALLTVGAVMVLLKWVVPAVAPLALAAYGIYRLFNKDFGESAVALGLAIVFWYLAAPLGGLLWLIGAGMAGLGLFFLIRGIRGQNLIE